jgi:phage protein D
MPQPIPLFEETETFYAPYFEVRLRDNPLPDDVLYDVMQVTYRDNVNEIDSFEMTVNNWDAQTRRHKYEGAVDPASPYVGIFDPGTRIEVWMGYRGQSSNKRLMLVGEITTLEPSFPESGGSTLSVRGQNVLYTLKKQQHSHSWGGPGRDPMRDSDIAEWLGSQAVSDRRPGLGMRVRIDPAARSQEQPETFVFMNNQYDIVFLLERARRHGYTVFMELDENGEDRLYFGPSENLRDVTYKLEWGKSLIQVRPTLTTTNQVSQVTVRGWNRRTASPIEVTVRWGDRGLDINRDQQAVALAVQGRHEVIADRPFYSEQEARDFARRTLLTQLKDMVRVSASTVGLPDLRAGRQVELARLGPRYSGVYFITETTHTINDSGYRTTFVARRERALDNRREEQL